MSSRLRGSDFVDTVPGRNFVAGFAQDFDRDAQDLSINEFLRGLSMDTLLWEAQKDISTYLYGTGMDDALQVDTRDPAIVAMAAAIAEELGSPTRDTFTSPQRHRGPSRDAGAAVGPQQDRLDRGLTRRRPVDGNTPRRRRRHLDP